MHLFMHIFKAQLKHFWNNFIKLRKSSSRLILNKQNRKLHKICLKSLNITNCIKKHLIWSQMWKMFSENVQSWRILAWKIQTFKIFTNFYFECINLLRVFSFERFIILYQLPSLSPAFVSKPRQLLCMKSHLIDWWNQT